MGSLPAHLRLQPLRAAQFLALAVLGAVAASGVGFSEPSLREVDHDHGKANARNDGVLLLTRHRNAQYFESGDGDVQCDVGDNVSATFAGDKLNASIVRFNSDGTIKVSFGESDESTLLCDNVEKHGKQCFCPFVECFEQSLVPALRPGDDKEQDATIKRLNFNGTITLTWDDGQTADVMWAAVTKGHGSCASSRFLPCVEGDHVRVFRSGSSSPFDVDAIIHSVKSDGNITVELANGRTMSVSFDTDTVEKNAAVCSIPPIQCVSGDSVLATFTDGSDHAATIDSLNPNGTITVDWGDQVVDGRNVLWTKVWKDDRMCMPPIPSAPCSIGDQVLASLATIQEVTWQDDGYYEAAITSLDANGLAEVNWQDNGEQSLVFFDKVAKYGVSCAALSPTMPTPVAPPTPAPVAPPTPAPVAPPTPAPVGPAALSLVEIAMIVGGSVAVIALGALLAMKRRKRRSGGEEDGLSASRLAMMARQLNDAKTNRAVNRWGMGCDLPAAGERAFFPAGFVPALSASESISAFAVFGDEEMRDMRALAENKTRDMARDGMLLVCDHVELIMSFTDESDLYVKLLKACRTTGIGSESGLDRYRDYLYHLERAMGNLPPHLGRTFRSIDVQVRAASYQVGSTITWQAPSSASKLEGMVTEFMRVMEEAETGSQKAVPLTSPKRPDIESFFSIDEEALAGLVGRQQPERPDIEAFSSIDEEVSRRLFLEAQAPPSRTALFGTIFIIESTSGKDISMLSTFPEEQEVLFPLNSHFRVMAHLKSDEEKRAMLSSPGWSVFALSQVEVFVLQQI